MDNIVVDGELLERCFAFTMFCVNRRRVLFLFFFCYFSLDFERIILLAYHNVCLIAVSQLCWLRKTP